MLVWFTFPIYVAGVPTRGLSPAFTSFRLVGATTQITPQPTIFDRGDGTYEYQYDAQAIGDASGVIDAGAALAEGDRWHFVMPTREAGITLGGSQIWAVFGG